MKDRETYIKELFSAGAHFGFSPSRRHPTVAPYIYTTKDGSDIFNLESTSELLRTALETLTSLGEAGKTVLFVSTKNETQELVKETALSLGMPYVIGRWIGGTLTNFPEMKKRIDRLATLREQLASGDLERKYTKKERVMLSREIDKLVLHFGGVLEMMRAPDLIIVVDPRHDVVAVREARAARVPVLGIMSSDCDVDMVTYPVLANDAHRESVSYLLSVVAGAYQDGKSRFVPGEAPATETDRRPRRTYSSRTERTPRRDVKSE